MRRRTDLSSHHICLLVLDGELNLAPIPENPMVRVDPVYNGVIINGFLFPSACIGFGDRHRNLGYVSSFSTCKVHRLLICNSDFADKYPSADVCMA